MYDAYRHEFHCRQESSSPPLPPLGNSDAEVTLRRKTEMSTRLNPNECALSCLHVTPHNLCDTSDVVRQARNAAYRIGTLWLETQFDEARASVFEGFGEERRELQ